MLVTVALALPVAAIVALVVTRITRTNARTAAPIQSGRTTT
jgi:hypothetical protein